MFIISNFLDSQDFEPGQLEFNWEGKNIYLSADSSYFKQTKFFLGWEWAGGGKISSALNVYGYDGYTRPDVNKMLDSSYLLAKPVFYSHNPDASIMNARGIQYEPTLQLDPNNPDKLVQRLYDTTKPVFGFLTRRGRIVNTVGNTNYNRLIIDSAILQGQVILDKPWPDDQLIFKKIKDKNENELFAIEDTFMCRKMYISINLRRFTTDLTDENVLKIELPYTLLNGDTGKIQFNQVPSLLQNDTMNLSNGRGIIRKLDSVPSNTRSFYITKRMLPKDTDTVKDITISAFFICDGETQNPSHNPHLNYGNDNPITNLGIRFTYLNSSCPVAIDWVRFETPHAQRFLRGQYDDLIKTKTKSDIDTFINSNFPYKEKGIKLFRYKLGTDFNQTQNFIGIRYFSKLVGNIFTLVESFSYPLHYNAYCNPPDRSLSFYKVKP